MEIRPFKAIRFDPAVVGDVGRCIAPPYDVIDQTQQQQLYQKSPYNIIRITKGKTTETDTESDNQYTRAAGFFNDWLTAGVLKPDPAEAIYVYVQDFELYGRGFQRVGFVALARLCEPGCGVLPHECTLTAPKADRLKLRCATAGQFGLIFVLYDDATNLAERIAEPLLTGEPLADFVDPDNVRHRLYRTEKARDIKLLEAMMADKYVIIADGHHRYETALNYYRQTNSSAAAFAMMAFVNIRSTGLVILPIHRLAGGIGAFDAARLLDDLKTDFLIRRFGPNPSTAKRIARQEMLESIRTESGKGRNAFGIYAGGGRFYAAVLTNDSAMDTVPACPAAWHGLDVAVLHSLVIEKRFKITQAQLAAEAHIEYVKDTPAAIDEAVAKIDRGQKQIAFFMNPVRIEQVFRVASEGTVLPQKSTFFYPKFYTGLTIYKL